MSTCWAAASSIGPRGSGGAAFPLPTSHLPAELLTDSLTAEALETIEFAAVLDLVAAFAAGEGGAERVRGLRPSADHAWVVAELALVEEVTALYRRGDRIEAEPVPELRLAEPGEAAPRVRSQAERDLLRALRLSK